MRVFFVWLCTKHRLIFLQHLRDTPSAQRFDKEPQAVFIKASLPANDFLLFFSSEHSLIVFFAFHDSFTEFFAVSAVPVNFCVEPVEETHLCLHK